MGKQHSGSIAGFIQIYGYGLLLNGIACVFWAWIYREWLGSLDKPPSHRTLTQRGVAVAGLAYLTDYHLVPTRFTPGFELSLSRRNFPWLYAALAAGLIFPEWIASNISGSSPPTAFMEENRRGIMAKFHPQKFLAQVGNGKTTLTCPKKRILFSQGDAADAVFYIQTGKVKLSVISSQGKEAIIAMLEPGAFFGEGCLAGPVGVHGHGSRCRKNHGRPH